MPGINRCYHCYHQSLTTKGPSNQSQGQEKLALQQLDQIAQNSYAPPAYLCESNIKLMTIWNQDSLLRWSVFVNSVFDPIGSTRQIPAHRRPALTWFWSSWPSGLSIAHTPSCKQQENSHDMLSILEKLLHLVFPGHFRHADCTGDWARIESQP